jgi:transcription elongation factor Elf1
MSSESALGKASSSSTDTDKEFSCEYCGDVLSHESHLTRHKRLVHPEKLDHKCPTCGNVYSSERGLKLHHKRTHGETLTKEESECKQCGELFTHRDNLEPHTCSTECRDKWQIGEKASNWRGGKATLTCKECGSDFEVLPNKKGVSILCSRECADERRARQLSGESNHNWKGGAINYYGPDWFRQRRRARERDNDTCQNCGATPEEVGRSMDVHHIVPFRKFGVDNHEQANRLENLVCLCPSCHSDYEGLYLRPDSRK